MRHFEEWDYIIDGTPQEEILNQSYLIDGIPALRMILDERIDCIIGNEDFIGMQSQLVAEYFGLDEVNDGN